MQKFFFFLLLVLLPVSSTITKGEIIPLSDTDECRQLYVEMQLENIIDFKAFEQAYAGYNKIEQKKKEILTLIDFTKPSTEERMFVLDIQKKKILYTSLVSHGRNSGDNYATSFSNVSGSYKSSLGFFLTGNTYMGKNGYSLVLDGLEKGINDKARERAIVIHGADYSNPSFIAANGRLGRSQGCPALPQNISKPIINTIKNGSLVYVYADNINYLSQSSILSGKQRGVFTASSSIRK